MRAVCTLFALGILSSTAYAGRLSTLTAEGHFDNHDTPPARVVGAAEFVQVPVCGDWFASGACELYLDDVLVASSDGPLVNYALAGTDDGYVSYRLELRSAEGATSKVLTFFPGADYKSLVHSLAQGGRSLDSRPAGTVRRLPQDEAMDVAWSGFWTNTADRTVVTLYRGKGTDGENLGELVNVAERDEGDFCLRPNLLALPVGVYTLTHFDGTETLTAYFKYGKPGLVLMFR